MCWVLGAVQLNRKCESNQFDDVRLNKFLPPNQILNILGSDKATERGAAERMQAPPRYYVTIKCP